MLERLAVWALGSRHKLIFDGIKLLMVVSCSICFGITFITLLGFPMDMEFSKLCICCHLLNLLTQVA